MSRELTTFCRFGNFIGEAGDSEEESVQNDVQAQTYNYDDESEIGDEAHGQELMVVDGMQLHLLSSSLALATNIE